MRRKKYSTESFIEKAKTIHGDLYDYSETVYIKYDIEVCIIDKEYGRFFQKPVNHLSGYGCKKRYEARRGSSHKLTREEFIQQSNIKHNNLYDYSKSNYINTETEVCIIDPIYGEFLQIPHSHLKGHGCKERKSEERRKKFAWDTDTFIKNSLKIYGEFYDYGKAVYKNNNTKITLIDPDFGEFKILPRCHMIGVGHPRRSSSRISNASLSWLLSLVNSHSFVDPNNEPCIKIGSKNRYVDAYDPSNNTIFQFHGSYWHGWNGKRITDIVRYENTLKRDQEIRDAGYNLIVMWEHNWNPSQEDMDKVPAKKPLTTNFIQKAIQKYGDTYDYSKIRYVNSSTKITIIDKEFGEFCCLPRQFLLGRLHPDRKKILRNTIL